MPSPIGHSLLGFIVFSIFRPHHWRLTLWALLLVALISTLPDFDFIPGFIVGEPNLFHRGISHSFGFAALLSLVMFLFELRLSRKAPPRMFWWFFVLYTLHIVFDYFSADTRYPYGQPIFWPIHNTYLIFEHSLFPDIQRSPELNEFIPSLFSLHNLKAVLIESGFIVGLGGLLLLAKKIYIERVSARKPAE